MPATTQNEFVWTGTGRAIWTLSRSPPKAADFAVSQDGENRWVFRHYQYKSPVAVFTGENAAKALRALKVALVTRRLLGGTQATRGDDAVDAARYATYQHVNK